MTRALCQSYEVAHVDYVTTVSAAEAVQSQQQIAHNLDA